MPNRQKEWFMKMRKVALGNIFRYKMPDHFSDKEKRRMANTAIATGRVHGKFSMKGNKR